MDKDNLEERGPPTLGLRRHRSLIDLLLKSQPLHGIRAEASRPDSEESTLAAQRDEVKLHDTQGYGTDAVADAGAGGLVGGGQPPSSSPDQAQLLARPLELCCCSAGVLWGRLLGNP